MNHRNFEAVLTVTRALGMSPLESALLLLIAACADGKGEMDPAAVKPAKLRRACRAVAGETGMALSEVEALWPAIVSHAEGRS